MSLAELKRRITLADVSRSRGPPRASKEQNVYGVHLRASARSRCTETAPRRRTANERRTVSPTTRSRSRWRSGSPFETPTAPTAWRFDRCRFPRRRRTTGTAPRATRVAAFVDARMPDKKKKKDGDENVVSRIRDSAVVSSARRARDMAESPRATLCLAVAGARAPPCQASSRVGPPALVIRLEDVRAPRARCCRRHRPARVSRPKNIGLGEALGDEGEGDEGDEGDEGISPDALVRGPWRSALTTRTKRREQLRRRRRRRERVGFRRAVGLDCCHTPELVVPVARRATPRVARVRRGGPSRRRDPPQKVRLLGTEKRRADFIDEAAAAAASGLGGLAPAARDARQRALRRRKPQKPARAFPTARSRGARGGAHRRRVLAAYAPRRPPVGSGDPSPRPRPRGAGRRSAVGAGAGAGRLSPPSAGAGPVENGDAARGGGRGGSRRRGRRAPRARRAAAPPARRRARMVLRRVPQDATTEWLGEPPRRRGDDTRRRGSSEGTVVATSSSAPTARRRLARRRAVAVERMARCSPATRWSSRARGGDARPARRAAGRRGRRGGRRRGHRGGPREDRRARQGAPQGTRRARAPHDARGPAREAGVRHGGRAALGARATPGDASRRSGRTTRRRRSTRGSGKARARARVRPEKVGEHPGAQLEEAGRAEAAGKPPPPPPPPPPGKLPGSPRLLRPLREDRRSRRGAAACRPLRAGRLPGAPPPPPLPNLEARYVHTPARRLRRPPPPPGGRPASPGASRSAAAAGRQNLACALDRRRHRAARSRVRPHLRLFPPREATPRRAASSAAPPGKLGGTPSSSPGGPRVGRGVRCGGGEGGEGCAQGEDRSARRKLQAHALRGTVWAHAGAGDTGVNLKDLETLGAGGRVEEEVDERPIRGRQTQGDLPDRPEAVAEHLHPARGHPHAV